MKCKINKFWDYNEKISKNKTKDKKKKIRKFKDQNVLLRSSRIVKKKGDGSS
jgi:hypothetical protein